ncbi:MULTISPECIES: monovalent cation/H+ antiporter complex subunit F [unclassified Nocardioides]|uniref:monovalent cation/H+ antiporter complex subunit F n=1 Tax=unclassified Nocardioides TaxID=2615069 RepID=UPI0007016377|nr:MULTISPECIES: monovalent cation/H+ antiporter complex subunit F [unclassified Nocardioides]KQY57145.1 cation:proton antiporter [Nocardioides sp. Root140]KQZ68657.1 cation:proton antiporter [Nocardioides sp. Root151]KRF11785.1 cation:proton antiporter [Nocardioides sp. Soil796]
MTVVLYICAGMLGLASLLLLARMTMGPTMLDRTVALDVLTAVGICALALEAALNRNTTTLPILLVLTLLGFVGSVSIARFSRGSDDIDAEDP